MAKTKKKKIKTSLTLDYRKSAWGINRIVIDGISNHLPADSKGQNTSVKFKQDDEWTNLKKYDPKKTVQEVIFEDDGEGYDAGLLTVLLSTKTSDALSVGQFGEGLKLVAATCLREGIHVEYKSENWTSTPYAKPEKIRKIELERLCFETVENGAHIQGSRTRFVNPSGKLIEEILKLPENVLFFNDNYDVLYQRPTITGNISRIIDIKKDRKAIFVKGVKIANAVSLFSYDLGIENISPDRASFDEEKILDEIERLLRGCDNVNLLKQIILYAEQHPHVGTTYEFSALDKGRKAGQESVGKSRWDKGDIFNPINKKRSGKTTISKKIMTIFDDMKEIRDNSYFHYGKSANDAWLKAFRELYGKDAVIASYDTNENTDAELLGFKPVRLHHSIEALLADLGVENASQIENEKDYKWVAYKDLTTQEKALVDDVPNLVKFIVGKDVPVEVKVYEGVFFKTGREAESEMGVQITEANGKKYVGIKRAQLKNPIDFYQTLTHEFGHFYTDHEDYTRSFAEFFIRKLAEKYCQEREIPHEVKEPRIDISMPRIKNIQLRVQ